MANSNNALDFRDRDALFARLEAEEFDVLIIGGGITGCGTARDSAMRGLRVAMVDANDLASGTSSRSSKLVHGGMRYLAQGQVGLVREASTERKTLRRIAPHLAQRTDLVVPAHSRAGLLKFKTGIVAYEKIGQVERSEKHTMWSADELREREPLIDSQDLAGALVYPEYVTDDCRLVFGNARSAAQHGATIANYAAVESFVAKNGVATAAIVRDTLPGSDRVAQIRAKVIINATGPWLDALRKLEDGDTNSQLQLTKGIHVVLKRERLPIARTVIMTTPDRRSIFVVPRGEYVYFGTTDTFYPDSEYWPTIDAEDVSYLLDCGNATFTNGPFEDGDIVSLWSGIRPLVAQEGKSPSEISRKDEILRGASGVFSIAGGKLTSYRLMAKRIAELCESELGYSSSGAATDQEPLPGGDTADLAALESRLTAGGWTESDAQEAVRLYGDEVSSVYDGARSVENEAEWAVLREGAVRLEDYWVRRTARARFDADGGLAALEPASRAMASLLGWDEQRRAEEVAACEAIRDAEMSCIRTTVGSEG